MKNLFILVSILFATTQGQTALKFSPYIGLDYSNTFRSNTKPMFGMDFSYEFNNGLEFGIGSYLSKTKVSSSGDEIRPNNFIDFYPEIKENPSYFILKYNYKVKEKIKISPYGKVGKLNTSVYSNSDYNYIVKEDLPNKKEVNILRDETIFYGNNFYAFGLQYSYNNYFLSLEYKVRFLEQEYVYSNITIDYDKTNGTGQIIDSSYNYIDRTFKASSVSFMIGYTFDSKNRTKMDSNIQEKRYKKGDIVE